MDIVKELDKTLPSIIEEFHAGHNCLAKDMLALSDKEGCLAWPHAWGTR